MEAIASQLIHLIMERHYKSGQQLPSEPQLARMLRVGQGSVREALTALEVAGLLTVQKGRGTFVSSRSNFLVRPLSLGLRINGSFDDLMEARRAIEVEISGLAADRAQQRDLQAMRGTLLRMKANLGPEKWKAYIEADIDFHCALARAGHSTVLEQLMLLLRNLLEELFSVRLAEFRRAVGTQQSPADHEEVYAAIQRHEPGEARQAMLRLIANAVLHARDLSKKSRISRHDEKSLVMPSA